MQAYRSIDIALPNFGEGRCSQVCVIPIMIISASRRTDIPAFYAEWFINRVRAGYCEVPNPFNRKQISRVSLRPEDVDVIVFWTRHPRPLFPYLDELEQRGFRYYFHCTLTNYPRELEPRTPAYHTAVDTFRSLAVRIGAELVIWRYDPIVFSKRTGAGFHAENYAQIAADLQGYTTRSVVSIMDWYPKLRHRLDALQGTGFKPLEVGSPSGERFATLMSGLAALAAENGMQIQSCAEPLDLSGYGILPGKCVDDAYIRSVFGIEVNPRKDPGQRAACGCVISRDIGVYNTCSFGCRYCYATQNFDRARERIKFHDPLADAMLIDDVLVV